jgi:hypothetical protein
MTTRLLPQAAKSLRRQATSRHSTSNHHARRLIPNQDHSGVRWTVTASRHCARRCDPVTSVGIAGCCRGVRCQPAGFAGDKAWRRAPTRWCTAACPVQIGGRPTLGWGWACLSGSRGPPSPYPLRSDGCWGPHNHPRGPAFARQASRQRAPGPVPAPPPGQRKPPGPLGDRVASGVTRYPCSWTAASITSMASRSVGQCHAG